MYEFFKDFSGPIATIIASTAAAWITWRFNSRQTRIAQAQAETSLDKLKVDVHKERYEIYSAAKSLVETIGAQHDLQKINSATIRAFYVKLDEARFFFDSDVRAFLGDLHDQCEKIFIAHGKWRAAQNDDAKLIEWSNTLAAEETKLRNMYAELPKKFESALSLKKLTNPSQANP